MSRAPRHWETEFRSGALDFLDAPDEQLRHAVIASLIESHGRGLVCDLGCGAGHLLRWLNPRFVTGYIGVDVSGTALARIGPSPIPVETVQAPIEGFVLPPNPVGALVCSEVLYMLEDPGATLARIATSLPDLGALVVSLLLGRPDKTNWSKGTALVNRSIDAAGWVAVERVQVNAASTGMGWDIGVYRRPAMAGAATGGA